MKSLDPLAGVATFLAVAESLSFSKAGADMRISRATVGAQVQDLERRLGVRLFQRTTRRVALTEAGSAYRAALTGVLPQIREAERAAAAFQEEAIGRLRISVPPDLAEDHIVPVVNEFLARNPAVAVELDLSLEAVDLVAQGFDLAVRGTISVEPNTVTRRIGSSPIVICAAPAYLARHGVPRHPEDLAEHACLHFSRLRWGPVWHFQRVGGGPDAAPLRVPIVPRLACNDGRSLRAATLAGGGITLGAAFVLGPALREGRLVPVLTDWSVAPIPIHAVYPASRHIAAKVKSFVGLLTRRLADHPDLRG